MCGPSSRSRPSRRAIPPFGDLARSARRAVGRLPVAWLLLAFVASCDTSCFGKKKGKVTAVLIEPSEVHVAVGTTFALRAVALDDQGHVVAGDWDGSIAVSWSSATASFVDAGANPVSLSVATEGEHAVKVAAGGVSASATIIAHGSAGTEDRLSLVQPWAAAPAEVLIDAPTTLDADCGTWSQRRLHVAGVVGLGANLTESSTCVNEVAVFADDGGAVVRRPDPSWTEALELTDAPLPERLWVELKVWYFVLESETTLRSRANADLSYVDWVWRRNRAGVQYGPVEHVLTGRDVSYNGGAQATRCVDLSDFDSAGFEDDFKPTLGVLHVVYVRDIDWNSAPFGLACPSDPNRGDIVIISWLNPSLTTLVHELTHRLGASTEPACADGTTGHVTCLGADFVKSNVMQAHGNVDDNDERWSLTTGQVYRALVDQDSWLNRVPLRDPADGVKACQAQPSARCPPLKFSLRSP